MDLMETEELKESIQQYQQQTGEKFPADTKYERENRRRRREREGVE